jgi:acetoin utilization deacetylase AcuC-like enzyme
MPPTPSFALATHKNFLKHDTKDFHPAFESYECPARIAHTLHFLEEDTPALWQKLAHFSPKPASREQVGLVHSAFHIDHVARMQEFGLGEVGDSVNASPFVFDTALLAAGTVIESSKLVLADKYQGAFCLIRPPGHHATGNSSEGLCVFNNLAIATKVVLSEKRAGKVAIVDFDTHYGDGIASIFYEDPRVLYMSLHEMIFSQGERGLAEECGAGEGQGYNVCFPLPFQSTDECLEGVLELFAPITRQFKPDLILVAAGFDGHYADPVGNLAFTSRGFYEAGRILHATAQETCQGKVVAALEGGYNLLSLPLCVAAFLHGILGLDFAPTWSDYPIKPDPHILARFDEERAIFQKEMGQYWDIGEK